MDEEDVSEQPAFELFSAQFYGAIEYIIKSFLPEDQESAFNKVQVFIQAIMEGKTPKIKENSFVVRLLYLLAVHMWMLQTRRLSYSTKLERYACKTFLPCEIEFFNKAYVVFQTCSDIGEAEEEMHLMCQEYVERVVGKLNFNISFNESVMQGLDFHQSFFRACAEGLKCFIQGNEKNPHVIAFKRVLGGNEYQQSDNALVNFVRILGLLNQESLECSVPKRECELPELVLTLFVTLRGAHESCLMTAWYEAFDEHFAAYLEHCSASFTYHTRASQRETFYRPPSDGSHENLAEKAAKFKHHIVDGKMLIWFDSLGDEKQDLSAYMQFTREVVKVAISNDLGQPDLSPPYQDEGCIMFTIELEREEDLQELPSQLGGLLELQHHAEKSFN